MVCKNSSSEQLVHLFLSFFVTSGCQIFTIALLSCRAVGSSCFSIVSHNPQISIYSCRKRRRTCTMELITNAHMTAFTLDPSHDYVVYYDILWLIVLDSALGSNVFRIWFVKTHLQSSWSIFIFDSLSHPVVKSSRLRYSTAEQLVHPVFQLFLTTGRYQSFRVERVIVLARWN